MLWLLPPNPFSSANFSQEYSIMIMMEVTGKGRACIPEGLTKAKEVLVQLNKECRRKIP